MAAGYEFKKFAGFSYITASNWLKAIVKRIPAAIMEKSAFLLSVKFFDSVKRVFFVIGLLLLFSAEVLHVYFLMPFRSSQADGAVSYAYWLNRSVVGAICSRMGNSRSMAKVSKY
jgi:hypothetical protein